MVTKAQVLELIGRINAYRPDYSNLENVRKEWDAFFDEIADMNAKAGSGVKVGKTLRFQVADGYAVYIITDVLKNSVKVAHVNLVDGYHDRNIVSPRGSVQMRVAQQNVGWNDRVNKIAKIGW